MTEAVFRVMISGIISQKNNSSKMAAKTTNFVKDMLINELKIDCDKLNMELDKVYRLSLNY